MKNPHCQLRFLPSKNTGLYLPCLYLKIKEGDKEGDRQKASIKIGMRQRMKVPYREDLASHSGPEPHGGCGNTMANGWVGGSAKREWCQVNYF